MSASSKVDPYAGFSKEVPSTTDTVNAPADKDPYAGFSKEVSPSLIKMALPAITNYVNEAKVTGGIGLIPPKKLSNQSDEDHQKAVEDWQSHNRSEFEKASSAVMGDLPSFLSRATGVVAGVVGGTGVKKWVSGDPNDPSAEEMMANPRTSVLKPLADYGQEQFKEGHPVSGVAASLGSSLDNPMAVYSAAKLLGGVKPGIKGVVNYLENKPPLPTTEAPKVFFDKAVAVGRGIPEASVKKMSDLGTPAAIEIKNFVLKGKPYSDIPKLARKLVVENDLRENVRDVERIIKDAQEGYTREVVNRVNPSIATGNDIYDLPLPRTGEYPSFIEYLKGMPKGVQGEVSDLYKNTKDIAFPYTAALGATRSQSNRIPEDSTITPELISFMKDYSKWGLK